MRARAEMAVRVAMDKSDNWAELEEHKQPLDAKAGPADKAALEAEEEGALADFLSPLATSAQLRSLGTLC